jgi:hypothetical protein
MERRKLKAPCLGVSVVRFVQTLVLTSTILLDLHIESGILWGAPLTRDLRQTKPKWRNRQTRTTQNRVPYGNEGSIPSFGIRFARIIP